MCEKNLTFSYSALFLLVISSFLKSQQNFISNEEKNDNLTVLYEIDADSTTNYGDEMKTRLFDLYEKTTNNTQYEDVQYKSRIVSRSNDRENDDWKQWIEEFNENITETENSNKDKNTSYIIPYESCIDFICIQLCCPLGYYLDDYSKCILEENKYTFSYWYEFVKDIFQYINKTVNKFVKLTVYNPCQDEKSIRLLQPRFGFFENGSLYLSDVHIVKSTTYCAKIVDERVDLIICSETLNEVIEYFDNIRYNAIYKYVKNNKSIRLNYYIVSIPFLMSIFVVYSILPELRNEHGFMLCNYSGALSVAYITGFIHILIKQNNFKTRSNFDVISIVCDIIAFLKYLFFLASFFWLNIMSFDMWWTFRGSCSLQRNVKQRKKKKLVFYSIFAWSLSFVLAIISVIMDIVSNKYSKLSIRNEQEKCNFAEAITFTSYYYGLQSICIISNICLSISTVLKIARYEKETGNRLANLESRKHNDNKEWFNLYLKLFILQFILMGIKWSMMIILLISEYLSLRDYKKYFICIILLVDIMQNICTFIVFVWKRKIKRMLLKRFGCGFRCAINATSPSTESICTTTLEEMPMQKRMSSAEQKICHEKYSSFETKL